MGADSSNYATWIFSAYDSSWNSLAISGCSKARA